MSKKHDSEMVDDLKGRRKPCHMHNIHSIALVKYLKYLQRVYYYTAVR